MIEDITQLDDSIKATINKVIDPIIKQYDPLGIILVGSYANGITGDNSDLDIYIIARDQDWRERGNYLVDGIEIEYFINPVKQVRAYFRNEKSPQKHTAHMLATGIVLYQQDSVIEELIAEAEEVVSDNSEIEKTERELLRYGLDDLRKDLIDASSTPNSLEYQLTAARILSNLIHTFYRYYQQNMVKPRLMMDQIRQTDKKFAQLLDAVIQSNSSFESLLELLEYTEELLGGRRDKIWRLPGKLDL